MNIILPARAWCAWLLCGLLPGAVAQAVSPYAGEQTRTIKALSSQEIADLEAGRGMGLAKAAELNGIPGPLHVLELAEALALSAEQAARSRAIFARMQRSARDLGGQLIEAERALDIGFARRALSVDTLGAALDRIAHLQARLREAHLRAHLEQLAVLDEAQVARYAELRGYGSGPHHDAVGHGHPQHH